MQDISPLVNPEYLAMAQTRYLAIEHNQCQLELLAMSMYGLATNFHEELSMARPSQRV